MCAHDHKCYSLLANVRLQTFFPRLKLEVLIPGPSFTTLCPPVTSDHSAIMSIAFGAPLPLTTHPTRVSRPYIRPVHVCGAKSRSSPRASTSLTPSTAASTGASKSAVLERFLLWFRGDFDNFEQASEDRRPESGVSFRNRHQQIHCRLQPLQLPGFAPADESAIFATYWYNGNRDLVYRRRVYTVKQSSDNTSDEEDGSLLDMTIYKMSFLHDMKVMSAAGHIDKIEFGSLDDTTLYERLDAAKILWRFVDGPHDGDGFVSNAPHFVATMPTGGFVASSGFRYEDELVLTKQDLWVCEQVYSPEGKLVGGNSELIPHKMQRIRSDGDLGWTLDRDLPDLNAVWRTLLSRGGDKRHIAWLSFLLATCDPSFAEFFKTYFQ